MLLLDADPALLPPIRVPSELPLLSLNSHACLRDGSQASSPLSRLAALPALTPSWSPIASRYTSTSLVQRACFLQMPRPGLPASDTGLERAPLSLAQRPRRHCLITEVRSLRGIHRPSPSVQRAFFFPPMTRPIWFQHGSLAISPLSRSVIIITDFQRWSLLLTAKAGHSY